MTKRHDIGGAGAACLLLTLAAITWNLAERYRHACRVARAAAPLKYDESVIAFLRHGHAIASLMVGFVVAGVLGRVSFEWRRRGGRSPGRPRA